MAIHIGQKIKELVEERNLTNRDFSKLLDMTENNIYKIFKKNNIDTDLLLRICKILNVPILVFFEEKAMVTSESSSNLTNDKYQELVGITIDIFYEVLKIVDKESFAHGMYPDVNKFIEFTKLHYSSRSLYPNLLEDVEFDNYELILNMLEWIKESLSITANQNLLRQMEEMKKFKHYPGKTHQK